MVSGGDLQKSQAVILEKLETSHKECRAAKATASALKKQVKATRHHCENVIAAASADNPVFEVCVVHRSELVIDAFCSFAVRQLWKSVSIGGVFDESH